VTDTGEGFSLVPRGSRLLVKKDESEEKIGGIVIPAEYRDRPTSGRVVAIGPEQSEFAVGQRVIFGQFSGMDLVTKAGTQYLLDADEILGSLP
jgi:chaperonin GroES